MTKKVARGIAVIALGVMLAACSSGGGGGAPADLAKAISDQQAGNTALAKKEFQAVVKADPNNKFGWYNLGVIAYNAGHVSEADTDYQKALKIDPAFESALYNYGYDRYIDRDNSTAVIYLRRAVKASPTDASAHLYLGRALAAEAGTDKALAAEATKELNTALRLNPAFKKNLCQILGLDCTKVGGSGGSGGTGAQGSTSTTPVTAGKSAPTTTQATTP